MKYTIEGFQQATMIEYGFDCVDAVILRYIVDFWMTGKMATGPNGWQEKCTVNDFFWLNYGTVIKELPIINIKKQALSDRMQGFVDCGLMEKRVLKFDKGTFTMFRIVPDKYEKLVSYNATSSELRTPTSSELRTPTSSELRTPTSSELRTKYTSTKENHSTKKKGNFVPPTANEVTAYVAEKNLNLDVNHFMTYYGESGWKDAYGKSVKNWKLKAITCSRWPAFQIQRSKDEWWMKDAKPIKAVNN